MYGRFLFILKSNQRTNLGFFHVIGLVVVITIIIIIIIIIIIPFSKRDHLGDWSPEKDCC